MNEVERFALLGYRLIHLRTKEFITDTAVLAGRGRCHVLACPAESSFLSELQELDTTGL